jgi:hypothetical protein
MHIATNADFYRQFASDDAAADYVQKLVANGRLAAQSGADAKFKEIAQDPHLLKLVADVYEGYRKVFAKETEGLATPPRVAIVESGVINAFALGPGFAENDVAQADQSPWIFMVHTALLNAPHTDTELRACLVMSLATSFSVRSFRRFGKSCA